MITNKLSMFVLFPHGAKRVIKSSGYLLAGIASAMLVRWQAKAYALKVSHIGNRGKVVV